jgi:hypothetical protein
VSTDSDLHVVFKALWVAAGEPAATLPEIWKAQVAVWAYDGIGEADLRRFFRAWSAKLRTASVDALWRYLQVCCFNLTHPTIRRERARLPERDGGFERVEPFSDPSWMGRDPGFDGGSF